MVQWHSYLDVDIILLAEIRRFDRGNDTTRLTDNLWYYSGNYMTWLVVDGLKTGDHITDLKDIGWFETEIDITYQATHDFKHTDITVVTDIE